ncbi:hypothetical protein [Chryseobacterium potabilaquae]|uniref:Uncharacterized protein n=1 Tax=Chryseobacterium potabilaquae TaxID=2675057 RepID=A0A6N4X7K0_9FLAO|nr:hypothetical protein [Chryseobacterium potabilaquae]CAA7195427.1 hypothetical protein CHRY9293_01626 [Chryseobacterium potabilaquae]
MESIINRNAAYLAIISELAEKRQYIFNVIELYPNVTSKDIEKLTFLRPNQITSRVSELKNLFFIKESGSRENHYSKRGNTTYRIVESMEERIDLINAAFVSLRDEKSSLEMDYHLNISNYTRESIDKKIKKIKRQLKSLGKILNTIQQAA